MKSISVAISDEEAERLESVLRERNLTTYSFAKDAILKELRNLEETMPQGVAKQIVLDMVQALRDRKWYLYQIADYSDNNHRQWLAGRFRKATKNEVADAVALFRTVVK